MIGNFVFTVAILAVVLGVLVFVHELGHYMACKAFGVWVHRFSIGIGKPIPGLTFHRGETEWAVSWLPLGGYVKMASRDEEAASAMLEGQESSDHVPPDRVFEAKPVWQRMVIILSGVIVNVAFALLIFTGLAWRNGRHYDPTTTLGHVAVDSLPVEAKAVASIPIGTRIAAVNGRAVKSWDDIGEQITSGGSDRIVFGLDGLPDLVVELNRDALAQRAELAQAIAPTQIAVLGTIGANSPAQTAGLAVGDSIVSIDGVPVTWWADAVERIQPAAGKALQIVVVRSGIEKTFSVTPKAEHLIPEDAKSPMIGRIGVAARNRYLSESLSLGGALKAGADASVSSAGTIFRTLRGLLNGRVASSQIGGPILIGQMAAQEARAGIEPLLAFIALISINLAVINLLPIPVLDGGAFVFLLFEGIARRPLPTRLREVFSMIGLAIVVLLMAFAMKNDIFRWFGK